MDEFYFADEGYVDPGEYYSEPAAQPYDGGNFADQGYVDPGAYYSEPSYDDAAYTPAYSEAYYHSGDEPQYQNVQQPAYEQYNSGAVPGGPEDNAPGFALKEPPGALAAIGASMGLTDKDGGINWKDPKVIDQWIKAGLGGAQLLNAIFGDKKRGYKTPQVPNPHNSFTPAQRSWGEGFYGSPINVNRPRLEAKDMRNPVVAGRGFAGGGAVQETLFDRRHAALAEAEAAAIRGEDVDRAYQARLAAQRRDQAPRGALRRFLGFAEGGMLPEAVDMSGVSPTHGGPAYLQDPTASAGGQDDVLEIAAAPGEYIFDAETVSMLGDGSNERGAALLDEMRMRLRAHKREAPVEEIPPRAMSPLAYLSGEPDVA